EIVRGLDVFELVPSEYLTENEIAAARLAEFGAVHNPQQQYTVRWPSVPVVARAYRDQLVRDGRLSDAHAAEIERVLARADAGRPDEKLARDLIALAKTLDKASREHDGATRARYTALATTLEGIAGRKRTR